MANWKSLLYHLVMACNLLIVGYHIHLERKSMDEPIDCRTIMMRSVEAMVFAMVAIGFYGILRQDIYVLVILCGLLFQQRIYLLGTLILAQIVLWLMVKEHKLGAFLRGLTRGKPKKGTSDSGAGQSKPSKADKSAKIKANKSS